MGSLQTTAVQKQVKDLIASNKVMIFSKTTCPFCKMAKGTFDAINVEYNAIELDKEENGSEIQDVLLKMTGTRTVPRIFINRKCIGGESEMKKLHNEGKLVPLIEGRK